MPMAPFLYKITFTFTFTYLWDKFPEIPETLLTNNR